MFDKIVDLIVAGLDKWTLELQEFNKSFEDREYWRGYKDGYDDAEGR